MSKVVFHSPRTGSAAIATAPARLAKELGEEVRWRERGDGVIEVAARRGRHLDRYVVNPDGSTSLIESGPPLSQLRRGTPIWVSGIVAIVAAGVLQLTDLPGLVALVWIGFGLIVIGGNMRNHSADPANRLKKLGDGDWYRPTDLHGWIPRTSEQLAAVEHIADEHDGVAYVYDLGAKNVEVYARHRRHLRRFWVDDSGRAELIEMQSLDRSRVLHAALTPALGAIMAAFFVSTWVLHNAVVGVILLASGVPLIMVGWLIEPHYNFMRRMKRQPLIEIRTELDEGD